MEFYLSLYEVMRLYDLHMMLWASGNFGSREPIPQN